jgi:hypothetical protein
MKPIVKPIVQGGNVVGWKVYKRGLFNALTFMRYIWR